MNQQGESPVEFPLYMQDIKSLYEDRVKKIIVEIYTFLENKLDTTSGLFGGNTGISLFYFYYFKHSNNPKSFNTGYSLLQSEMAQMDQLVTGQGNRNDLHWLVWALFHLDEASLISIDKSDFINVLPAIQGAFDKYYDRNDYDLLHGIIGVGLALKNLVPKDALCSQYIDYFNKSKLEYQDQIKWFWKHPYDKNQYGYNLGLAHGIPSIILFLNKLQTCTPDDKLIHLIRGSVNFLIANIQNHQLIGSYFPGVINEKSRPSMSRVAWCYGDLGIGWSIYKSGEILNDEEFKSKGLDILKYCASRQDLQSAMIKDLGICHGSAGLILMFRKLFDMTKDIEFYKAHRYWLNYTIEEIESKGDISNVLAWNTNEDGGPYLDKGFLSGLSGIGLVLLSEITDVGSSWSECLLID